MAVKHRLLKDPLEEVERLQAELKMLTEAVGEALSAIPAPQVVEVAKEPQRGPAGPQGAPGRDGDGLNWTGDYNPSRAYSVNDAVNYLGSSYIAVAPSQNKPPNQSRKFWNLMAASGAPGSQGAQGEQGLQGPEGPQGPQGPSGPLEGGQRLDALEANDAIQDADIDALQANDIIQDADIDALQANDSTQDTNISNLQSDVSQIQADIDPVNVRTTGGQDQILNSGALTILDYDQTDYNTGDFTVAANGRITVTNSGVYALTTGVTIQASLLSAVSETGLVITRNGNIICGETSNNTVDAGELRIHTCSCQISLTAGDVIDARAYAVSALGVGNILALLLPFLFGQSATQVNHLAISRIG